LAIEHITALYVPLTTVLRREPSASRDGCLVDLLIHAASQPASDAGRITDRRAAPHDLPRDPVELGRWMLGQIGMFGNLARQLPAIPQQSLRRCGASLAVEIRPAADQEGYRSGLTLGPDCFVWRSQVVFALSSDVVLEAPARYALETALRACLRRMHEPDRAASVSVRVGPAALAALRAGEPVEAVDRLGAARLAEWSPPAGVQPQDFCFGDRLRVAQEQLIYMDPVRGALAVPLEQVVHGRPRLGDNGTVLRLGADKAVKVLFACKRDRTGPTAERFRTALQRTEASDENWQLAHVEHYALNELRAAGVETVEALGVASLHGHPALVYNESFPVGSKDLLRPVELDLVVDGPGAELLSRPTVTSLARREAELVQGLLFPHDPQLLFRRSGVGVVADPQWLTDQWADPDEIRRRFQATFGRFVEAALANEARGR
jgi:hypothetical protein